MEVMLDGGNRDSRNPINPRRESLVLILCIEGNVN